VRVVLARRWCLQLRTLHMEHRPGLTNIQAANSWQLKFGLLSRILRKRLARCDTRRVDTSVSERRWVSAISCDLAIQRSHRGLANGEHGVSVGQGCMCSCIDPIVCRHPTRVSSGWAASVRSSREPLICPLTALSLLQKCLRGHPPSAAVPSESSSCAKVRSGRSRSQSRCG